MSIAVAFWIVWLFMLLFGGYGLYTSPNRYWGAGGLLFLGILAIVGWKLFGAPIHN